MFKWTFHICCRVSTSFNVNGSYALSESSSIQLLLLLFISGRMGVIRFDTGVRFGNGVWFGNGV